jgi:hypothetical protein
MPIMGGGGGGAAFNGGTITNTLEIDPPSGSEGLKIVGVDGNTTRLLDVTSARTSLVLDSHGNAELDGDGNPNFSIVGQSGSDAALYLLLDPAGTQAYLSAQSGLAIFNPTGRQLFGAGSGVGGGIWTSPQSSGALPTTTFVSGTGKQIDASQDRNLTVPVTFNPTAGAAATCVVALSPDNSTYSTLGTETEPAGIAFDGTIHLLRVYVPAVWYVKLTATNATIGTGTYY